MCGIVGYTGKEQAAPILLDGLSKLEYRGYDSAGIAVRNAGELPQLAKTAGKLHFLVEKTDGGKLLPGTCGIGHTRWATHGNPTVDNAHPHTSDNVIGVHNGIIENYAELREKLTDKGYSFYSETDTEVIVKLVDYYYKKYGIGPIDAINRTMVRARGSYALALMFVDYPGEIYAARKESPLVLGTTGDASFLASDVPAILKYTRKVYYIENLQAARITPGRIQFFNLNGDEITLPVREIDWDASAAEKGGYEHFMLKEIHEQPQAVRDTVSSLADFSSTGLDNAFLRSVERIYMVACGSALHAGIAGQYVVERLCGIPVRVEFASEFRYRHLPVEKGSLVVVVSQSGETADSLAALRKAKEAGLPVLGIVNVMGSSIAREADFLIHTMAGPEISVATTKAYSAQLAALYVFAVRTAAAKGSISVEEVKYYFDEISALPDKIGAVLEDKKQLQWFATKIASNTDIFYIGRGMDYAVCLEGSLKMKEISYIHSEAYAAGELKHGTISLIEDNTVVIGVLTQEEVAEKTVSNMIECRSRGAYLMVLAKEGIRVPDGLSDFVVRIPSVPDIFSASLAVVPLQLLGYYTSVNRGLDVDKPRNLAKSVTVE